MTAPSALTGALERETSWVARENCEARDERKERAESICDESEAMMLSRLETPQVKSWVAEMEVGKYGCAVTSRCIYTRAPFHAILGMLGGI